MIEDEGGNTWYKQGMREERLNHGVRGFHAVFSFQCEDCWMLNMEGRLPVPELDDAYVMLIRRANLDAMGGRAKTTIEGHAASLQRFVKNASQIRRTPSIPVRGPMPLEDKVGMGIAVDLLLHSLTAKPRLKGEKFIQFDTMRRPRATFSRGWESSPAGIAEGATFTMGTARVTVTSCPTQQPWFGLFMRGAETRMGWVSQQNKPFGKGVIGALLELVEEEMVEHEGRIQGEYVKFGAAVALAVCASLRGPEVFLLDLAGMWKHLEIGKDGVMPPEPMKQNVNLEGAPHIIVTLLGELKGELGTRHHQLALASVTTSGIKLRWWMEHLLEVREREGHTSGPAFGDADGRVGLISEYDGILHSMLRKLQLEHPGLIAENDEVEANYSFFRSFRRTAEGRARGAGLDGSVQDAMNRWRKIEQAKGRRPRFNMVDHYSHARDLMPVTWRYSFVQ